MPRPERPLEPGDKPLLRFAAGLRKLRAVAGGPGYRELAIRAHYSATTLSDAAAGRKLPTLAVTLAFVEACRGDRAEWEVRWRAVAAELAAHDESANGRSTRRPPTGVGPLPHEDMPPHIADLYREAAKVAMVSTRAGAALARATVERLIKHLDIEANPTDDLNTRIERLQHQVSSNLRMMLYIVRETGNDVPHWEPLGELAVMVLDNEQEPQLLEHLLQTANDLVDELISRQATVHKLHSLLHGIPAYHVAEEHHVLQTRT